MTESKIDWEEVEKEFREVCFGKESNGERIEELKTLAKENNREFVISGTSCWLVEYEG